MDDPFYNPASHDIVLSGLWKSLSSSSPIILVTVILAPLLLVVVARALNGRISDGEFEDEETAATQSYWFPGVSRGVSILRNTSGSSGNRGKELFLLDLNSPAIIEGTAKNDDPHQRSTKIGPATWNAVSKFFGLSAKPKYDRVLEQLLQLQNKHLSGDLLLTPIIQNLERTIPQMISFVDTPIDLQPWERLCSPIFISSTVVEVDLFSLLQSMLGHASIPAVFGRGLLENHPFLLQDVQAMDEGMEFFLLGLPAVTPWTGVFTAHMARRRVWEAIDGQQKALDALTKGEELDNWDLGDVSEFVLERSKLWREHDFAIKERGDICLLYALTPAPSHITYHLTLAILSKSALLSEILTEIKSHVKVTEGLTIGKHSSPPSLTISSQGLVKSCSLLRATYFKTLASFRKEIVGDRVTTDQFLEIESKNKIEEGKGAGFMEKQILALVAGVFMVWEFEPVEGEVWGRFEEGNMVKGGEGKRVRLMRKKFEWDA